jgi:polyisoprenoid-binding protein YceI
MKLSVTIFALIALMVIAAPVHAQDNPCNPCGKKAKAAVNPCAKNPCNACGKKAKAVPAVNPCYAKLGTVFTVNDPVKRNTVSFDSSAPLEDFTGTSNEVHGYLVFDPKKPESGVRGDFRVPVKSLDTGIPLRDEHLQGAAWLDAKKYPDLRIRIDGARRVKLWKKGKGFRTYEMTLSAVVTIHGKSKLIDIKTRITHLPESAKTKTRLPGDLLAGRATFSVNLKDFGIAGMKGVVGSKVSEKISIKVSIMGNTGKPKPANPSAKNACNPCGKSPMNPCAKNACNPCGPKR